MLRAVVRARQRPLPAVRCGANKRSGSSFRCAAPPEQRAQPSKQSVEPGLGRLLRHGPPPIPTAERHRTILRLPPRAPVRPIRARPWPYFWPRAPSAFWAADSPRSSPVRAAIATAIVAQMAAVTAAGRAWRSRGTCVQSPLRIDADSTSNRSAADGAVGPVARFAGCRHARAARSATPPRIDRSVIESGQATAIGCGVRRDKLRMKRRERQWAESGGTGGRVSARRAWQRLNRGVKKPRGEAKPHPPRRAVRTAADDDRS